MGRAVFRVGFYATYNLAYCVHSVTLAKGYTNMRFIRKYGISRLLLTRKNFPIGTSTLFGDENFLNL